MHHSREDLLRLGITPAETKHNQHRRAVWADYAGTGLYMVTLCVEGRQPVFGSLEGDIRAQRGTDAFPHLVPSALGRAILSEELPKIHAVYPQVELWQAALMRRDRQTGQPTELTPAFAAARDRQLAEARQGVVLVSPAISTPERMTGGLATGVRPPIW